MKLKPILLLIAALIVTATPPKKAEAGFLLLDGSRYEKSVYSPVLDAVFRLIGTNAKGEETYATGVAITDGKLLYTAYPERDAPWPSSLKRLRIANRRGEIVYDTQKDPAPRYRTSPSTSRLLEQFCVSPCPEAVRYHSPYLDQGLILELPFALTSSPLKWSDAPLARPYSRAFGFPENTYFSRTEQNQGLDVYLANRGKVHLVHGNHGPLAVPGVKYLLEEKADSLLFFQGDFNHGLNGAPVVQVQGAEVVGILTAPYLGWLNQYDQVKGKLFIPAKSQGFRIPLLTAEMFATFEPIAGENP